MAQILLIDRDETVAKRVQPVLAREGYRVAHTLPGRQALDRLQAEAPDLMLLSIDPPPNGWQFCHELLACLECPLLLLLPNADERERIKGLRLGADDCMAQPVQMGELAARIAALLRRRGGGFQDGDLVVDLAQRQVRLDGEPLALTPTELRVLACLVRQVGEVVPHQQLLAEVWGPERQNSPGLLRDCIRRLQQKLEPDPDRPRRIVTCPGQGYMLQRLPA
jgi:two-component system KDP operon response regulator KdpE